MDTLDSDVPAASPAVSDPLHPVSVDPSEAPSSHPPAKRQKRAKASDTEAADSALEYTNASFQPAGPPSSAAGHRKNSHGSMASARPDWTPSMRSSNHTTNCAGNVQEFRATEDLTRPNNRSKRSRPYKNRSGTSTQSRPANVVDLTSSKEDADELSPPDSDKAKHPEISGDALGRRFTHRKHQTATVSVTSGSAKRKGSPDSNTQPKRQRKFASPPGYDEKQGSPDPLGHDEKRPDEAEPRKPCASVSPSNESTKSHAQPTSFRPTAIPISKKTKSAAVGNSNREAHEIVGDGLCVKRSVSGFHWFEEGMESSMTKCFLRINGPHTILHAADDQGNLVDGLRYFSVNIRLVKKVALSQHGEHPIAFISQAMDNKNSSGAKLHLEFAGMEELKSFKKWLYAVGFHGIEDEDGVQLNRKMQKSVEVAMNHWNKRRDGNRGKTDTNGHLPDDLQLIQNKRQTDQPAVQNDNPKLEGSTLRHPKIKDSMKSQSQLQQEGEPVGSRPSLGVKYSSPAGSSSGNRLGSVDLSADPDIEPARSTRSMVTRKSPTQSPQPPGWTEMHPEWVNGWRNSIVFPAQGKNRATVDKADIYRLDEGEFLNDNLIIFYFRYLQQRLELDSPDLAKRIYFHNTFFFEKLKPDRTGGDIRFDSVKTWTSRVDLFTKDFIIVPINEHSHWYVAIICNAPKLVPSEPVRQLADSKAPATEPDALPADSKEYHGVSPLGSDGQVTSDLRRMSLDGTVKTAPEAGGPSNSEGQESISLVKASDEPNAVVGETQSASAAAGRKKAPKKILTGGRKNDPNQPKIITLDSLGAPHSRACQFLKKYLVAELADKKGIDIEIPRALGMTAKSIPEQSNFCDCGLYVLGYIARFLDNPDQFVNGLIAHEKMEWDFNSSALREEIRNLLFHLQEEQQKIEDAQKEAKAARAKMGRSSRPQSRQSRDGNHSPAQQALPAAFQETAIVGSESVQPDDTEPEVRRSIEDTMSRTQSDGHLEQHPFGIGSSTAQQHDTARSSSVETEEMDDMPVPGNHASGDASTTPAKGKRQSAGKPADDSPRQSVRKAANTSPDGFVKPLANSSPHGSSADRPFDVDDTPEHDSPKHPQLSSGKRSRIQDGSTKELRGQRRTKMNSSPYFGPSKRAPPKEGETVSAKMLDRTFKPMVIEDD